MFVEDNDLKTHFEKLAQRYPLEQFEKSMAEFIQMILSTTDTPALDKVKKIIIIFSYSNSFKVLNSAYLLTE